MKPISLKITAFGPYAKEVSLNFKEDLNSQDIFVITGPTGAGKTTIFDAICYALYGETSGAKRKGEELRSDFSSKGDLKTEIEFTFSVKEKVYKITRAPKQQQKKKRGKGMTEVPASAELKEIESQRAPLTKDNEIRQEIQNIIGLNVDQFRKIIMIPQGDFKEFLFANTTNKEELLRKIFGTDLYKAVQEQLHEKAAALKVRVAQIRNEIKAQLSILNTEDNSSLQQLITEDGRLSIIFEEVKSQIELYIKAENNKIDLISKLEQDILANKENLQEIQLINEKFLQHDKIHKRLLELETKKPMFIDKEVELLHAKQARELEIVELEVLNLDKRKKHLNDDIQKFQIERSKLVEEFDFIKQAYERIDEDKQRINVLMEKESQLSFYDQGIQEVVLHKQKLQALEIEKELQEKKLKVKQTNLFKIEEQLVLMDEHQKLLEKLKEKSLGLKVSKLEVEAKLNEVILACEKYDLWKNYLHEGEKVKVHYEKLKGESERLKEHYDHQGRLFVQSAAIGLANELEIGMPCPVCGSTEHPRPNQSDERIMTQKELNQLRDRMTQLNQKVQIEWQRLTSVQIKAQEKEIELNEIANNFNFEKNEEGLMILKSQTSETYDDLIKEIENLEEQSSALQNEIIHLLSLQQEQKELINEIKGLEQENQDQKVQYLTIQKTLKSLLGRIPDKYHGLKTLAPNIKEIQVNRSDLEKNVSKTEENYQHKLNQLTILQTTLVNLTKQLNEVSEDYKRVIQKFENEVSKIFVTKEAYKMAKRTKDVILGLENEVKNFSQEMYTTKHMIHEINQELIGKVYQNHQPLMELIQKLDLEKETLRKELSVISMKRQQFDQILQSTLEKYNKIQQQEDEYAIVGELSELANGRTAGKMSFETYVLSSYFDEVLDAANQRLRKMTSSRYYLLRRDEIKGGGRKGLDLDVYDSHTCKKRPVNTLSGGESFKASLALALGLSDTVQQNAGGIQLDTMFIDEGFGTLDSDSLEQAIDILMDLQDHGRLIGVISHVNELKERIPAKLIVQVSSEGSTAYIKK